MKRVKRDMHLQFPPSFGYDRYWGGPGTVVDDEHPKIAEWIQGQEHKLEDAPKGAQPDDIRNVTALGEIKAFELEQANAPKPKPVAESVAETASAASAPDDIPAPDHSAAPAAEKPAEESAPAAKPGAGGKKR